MQESVFLLVHFLALLIPQTYPNVPALLASSIFQEFANSAPEEGSSLPLTKFVNAVSMNFLIRHLKDVNAVKASTEMQMDA